MAFIQVIEFSTNRLDEVESLMDEWIDRTEGQRSAHRSVLTVDRDQSGTYVQIVEFPSYQAAMENSNLPITSEFAERLSKLCQGPAKFRNLDVRRTDDLT
jgi:quinol monooxygenase YgiN